MTIKKATNRDVTSFEPFIASLAFQVWKKLITPFKEKLSNKLLKELHDDRHGAAGNSSAVNVTLHSLLEVMKYDKESLQYSLYEEIFETRFLEETALFYKELAQHLLAKGDCSLNTAQAVSLQE